MDTSSADARQVELNLGDHVEGRYSNVVMITHTPTEVVLDFAVMMPGMEKPQVVSRVIVTPEHAKRLLAALGLAAGAFIYWDLSRRGWKSVAE